MAGKKRGQSASAPATQGWADLTWYDVEAWAGTRSLQRGRTEDGALLAWVQGTERYATTVELTPGRRKADRLTAECSCPVGYACKHAVAVVVEYLNALKEGRDVPLAEDDDPRWDVLEDAWPDDNDEEGDDEEYSEDDDDEEYGDEEEAPPLRKRRSRKAAQGGPSDLRAYLEGLPAEELVRYVLQLADRDPAVARELAQRNVLASGEVGELVRQARKEIRLLTREPAWVNSWSGEGNVPDYSGLRDLFRHLLDKGEADALLDLGTTLMNDGVAQVEQSHDEGETMGEIVQCLDVVFEALPRSSRPDAQKLLYAIDLRLKDDYDLTQGASAVLERDWPRAAWSEVADALAERLKALPAPKGDAFTDRYHRDRLSHRLIQSLEAAGRNDEVLPLMEAEARATGSYERLVDRLLAAKRWDDAERWALEGIARTDSKLVGIANSLRDRIRTIWERRRDWPAVAGLRAEEFFAAPRVDTLDALQKAADKAGCGPEVRAAALHFLETGIRPRPASAVPPAPTGRSSRRRPAAPQDAGPPWPLPETPAALRPKAWPGQVEGRPHFDVLLNLALRDKQPAEVLRWYDRILEGRRGPGWGYGVDHRAGQVADAVAATHPDRALELYRRIAEGYVAQTSPSAYESAAPYLRKARALLHRLGRNDEWIEYETKLREDNRRKRKFLETLDRLQGRKIVEG
jgi:uncharacterized Zn finger protein